MYMQLDKGGAKTGLESFRSLVLPLCTILFCGNSVGYEALDIIFKEVLPQSKYDVFSN